MAAAVNPAKEPLPLNLSGRIPELDGIRGLAIGLVLLWHFYVVPIDAVPRSVLAYLQAAGRLTWSGVDLFFVLSGFLIGGILLDNREATNYFRVFYTRRFFRILPAYFLCVSVVYLLMRLIESGTITRLSFLSSINVLPWAPHLLFLQNLWMAARNAGGILVITWSLAIEEQFYLTLPLLVRFLSPKRLLTLVCVVIVAAPLLRLTLTLMWPGHPWAAFALLPCRADSLMLGVLGAIILRKPAWKLHLENNRSTMRLAIAVLAVGALFLTKFSFDQLSFGMLTVGYSWIALLYVCLLLYVLTARQGSIAALFRWSPLGRLGTLAYGVYLSHMFVLWATYGFLYAYWPRVFDLRSFGLSLPVLLVTLILCQASWAYFEKPLVRFGHRTQYEFQERAPGSPTINLNPEKTVARQ